MKRFGAFGALLVCLLTSAIAAPAFGQTAKPTPKTARASTKAIMTKRYGEDWAIRKRQEWFYASRRQGSQGLLAQKRAEAVDFTRGMTAECAGEGTAAWIPRGPFSSNFSDWRFGRVSGRTVSLAKDWTNNILYLGSASGGLWKSTDDGSSWASVFDQAGTQTIGEVSVDPKNPNVIWAGTGENSMYCEEYFGIGLLRSADGGATWELRNGSGSDTLEGMAYFASVVIDPRNSDRLVVGGFWGDCSQGDYQPGGIYTTDNAGVTWTKRLRGYVTEIVRDPVNPDLLWAGVGYAGVFKSTDGGNTWLLQTASGLPSGYVGRIEVAVSPSNPNVVYALFESVNESPAFWRTTDGGATWRKMSDGSAACDGQCWYNMVLRVHDTNPDTVFKGVIHVYRSLDGGATWKDLSNPWGSNQKVHQDTHALLMDPSNPDTFYVGCDGGIWKTTDGGSSFVNLNANLSLTQFYDVGIHPTDDGVIVGGAQDNSSLARSGSDTWDLQEVTGDGFVTMINPQNPDIVYITSYPWGDQAMPSLMRSDGGLFGPFDWVTAPGCGITAGDRISWVTPYTLDPHSPSVLFLGTHRVYRSLNGGLNWSRVGPEDMAGGEDYLAAVTISRKEGRFVYAGTTNGRVWRTTDGGSNWSEISGGLPKDRWVNDVEADAADPSKAFCVLSGFGTAHLWEFAGAAWEPRGEGLPDVPANTVLMTGASTLYVGTDVGVFRSSDRGVTFAPFQAGMPMGLVITDLEFNETTGTITAGTYGRGAWQVQPPTCTLACSVTAETSALKGTPASFTASGSAPGCTGTFAYHWDFGDGATSTEQSPSHIYTTAGVYTWSAQVSFLGQVCADDGAIYVTDTPPPTVSSMKKQGSPFRISVAGTSFQTGVKVYINGTEWAQVQRKSETSLLLQGGASLKAAVPKGTPTSFRFRNPDGGEGTFTWQWP